MEGVKINGGRKYKLCIILFIAEMTNGIMLIMKK